MAACSAPPMDKPLFAVKPSYFLRKSEAWLCPAVRAVSTLPSGDKCPCYVSRRLSRHWGARVVSPNFSIRQVPSPNGLGGSRRLVPCS